MAMQLKKKWEERVKTVIEKYLLGVGAGRGVQDWEFMYTLGRFILMHGKTNIVL